MTKILINYADKKFFESQKKNRQSAIDIAGFDTAICYNRDMLDKDWLEKNHQIMSQERGAGMWLWKPYIIRKQFDTLSESDILMYSDSGAVFIRNLEPIFDEIKKQPLGIAGFSLSGGHYECQYNRRHVIESFEMNPDIIGKTFQHMASFVILRICEQSKKIIDFWLDKCSQPDLIMDKDRDENEFPHFIDHRHDQALWSLTIKKFNVPVYKDPTQWGLHHQETTQKDYYIYHHRSKN